MLALPAALIPGTPAGLPSASAAVTSEAAPKPLIRYIFAGIGSEATSLVIGASVDTGGADTSYYVEYGRSAQYGSHTSPQTLPAKPQPGSGFPTTGELRVTITDLAPETRYHYRLVVTNALGSVASPQNRTIVSGGKAPRLSDAFVRNGRTRTSTVLGATVDTGGLVTASRAECGPYYRIKSADVILPALPSRNSWAPTKREARFLLNGLTPGKHYRCRIVASNAAGSAAFQRDFDSGTPPHGIQFPAVGIGPTATSVVLGATIDTGGLRTTYHVKYGSNGKYSSSTPRRSLRPNPGKGWSPTTTEIRVPLSGLAPATIHYFRIVATNAEGTESVARSFVSEGRRPAISYLFAGPSTGTSSASFGGAIDTGGLPTTYFVLYGPSLSYGSQTAIQTLPALPSPESFRPTVVETRSEEIVVRPGATLHYRIVATNAAGRTSSSDRTYTPR